MKLSMRLSMKSTRRSVPVHLAILVGCSTGAYAASLAFVTSLQSRADAAVVRARDPIERAVATVASRHDQLDRSVSATADAYDRLASTYATLDPAFATLEHRLDDLAALTSSISKSAASLPSRVSLPAIHASSRQAAPPRIHAITGASG